MESCCSSVAPLLGFMSVTSPYTGPLLLVILGAPLLLHADATSIRASPKVPHYLGIQDARFIDGQKGKGKHCLTKKNTSGGAGSQVLKWTGIQNKNLAKTWIHFSEDRIKSNNQQLDVFWDSVLDAFHDFFKQDDERIQRTVSSLKNHWSDMNRAFKVYGTCLKNVMQGLISGMQQGNLDDTARMIYEALGKGKWVYKKAYKVLSCHQLWKILQNQHPDTLARNVRMKQISSSSPGMYTLVIPDTPVSSNNDSPVLLTDVETERLDGIKTAKLKEKNKKRQNLPIERQNIFISRLDRIEKKKEEYIAEGDKKKE
ncbi:hypothetical protein GIB67_021070 [Kingdonia uniflora]|uniref:No apical meristem-associated C-terminal domain-containing protein n=1 Tax=Kingdonia uniflora TaxID=39325 RepID=A0A7J7N6S7_9MAGN|nr:hypothetical protein GIB67_021070 [Kingdonia uniflora]